MDISITSLIKTLFGIIPSAIADWGSIHPIINHFPLVLLFITPFFILLGLFFQKSKRTLNISALLLMLFGTITLFLTVTSGNYAAEHLTPNPEILPTLNAHVQLGEKAKLSFSILSCIFFLFIVLHTKISQKFTNKIIVSITLIFLAIYSFNLIILFNAAHYGGKLVHKYKLTSTLFSHSE